MLTLLEFLTELGVYFIVIFSPWAFGATEPWSLRVVNSVGYFLGVVWLLRLMNRWFARRSELPRAEPPVSSRNVSGVCLFVFTSLLLAYAGISAWNARATYQPELWNFRYHRIISWLPHSYDRAASIRSFQMYLGLFFVFWSFRDWLQHDPASDCPPRLRRFLWVLGINTALLAIISIIQRLDGTGKLLWLVEPHINKDPTDFFGPFAYRANASQYFNLVWPVALALWWTHQNAPERRPYGFHQSGKHHLLLSVVLLIAVCPIIATSRGGALIMAGLSLIVIGILIWAGWKKQWINQAGVVCLLALAILLGLLLGWVDLGPNMEMLGEGFQHREEMFYTGRRMAEDNPLFGTGPGSFNTLFQLYRGSAHEYWPAQMHNDWLETLITFGWVGLLLILLNLGCCVCSGWVRRMSRADKCFYMLVVSALFGCLLHARYDFPFQVYSILCLFLLLCAVLSTMGRPAESNQSPFLAS